MKIGTKVRQGWQRRCKRLLVQETCYLEWQNIIAEASRRGYSSDNELLWDSYEILDEQLKKEWLENVAKRKTIARPKGGKRAPKSPEQRKKISEAISAKWNNPEYRNRVCTALAKYHGVPVGAERKRRKRVAGEYQPAEQRSMKKTTEAKDASAELKLIKKDIQKNSKTSAPLFRDPTASSKLEMIKKIKEQRATLEAKKQEAIERAVLLIAEAEKATKALEAAALKSLLAHASLLEARKLIAEATHSIQSIEGEQLASQQSRNNISLESGKFVMHVITGDTSDEYELNGRHILSPNHGNLNGSSFSDSMKQSSINGGESLSTVQGESSLERPHTCDKVSSLSKGAGDRLDIMVPALKFPSLNGSVSYNNKFEDKRPLEPRKSDASMTSLPKPRKMWVRGRLVEVKED
ncbi:hypothetical protein Taro_020682 [Colocasia esculenta]|uniref:Nuclease associated modular domain-containing protein n=1 Tax=Colocasia esculenta TaxID=4460 RepID=A0A843UPA2_COLES|nr:hypothetical protein [Colocasia esculenta]